MRIVSLALAVLVALVLGRAALETALAAPGIALEARERAAW